jgi:hypothetical protein
MFRFDLHIHSKYSYDCTSQIEEIIKYAKKRGLSGIAITDHDTMEGSLKAKKMEKELKIIMGMEISSDKGHIIALGIEEPIKARKVNEIVEEVHERGGICVVPHPFYKLHHGMGEIPKGVDAIETFNSRFLIGINNIRAKKVAEELKIAQTGGSDAHSPNCVGFGFTISPSEDVIEEIRKSRTKSGGERTPLLSYAKASVTNMKKRLRLMV